MKPSLTIAILVALCVGLYPVASISRWFTASYYDVRVTLRRYARCEGSLTPLKKQGLTDTEFLVDQIRLFLDQANYDNEQLANVTQFMGTICRPSDAELAYPISMHIDVQKYNTSMGKHAKASRCMAIDRAMDSMFGVFKRAALNKSEPLDFSAIQYPSDFPNSPKDSLYNLTDLINTVWISSETMLDQTCNITRSITEYVQLRTSNSTAQDRSQSAGAHGFMGTLLDLIDRILDPILGLQKRLYWDSNNRIESLYNGIGSQLVYLRDGIGKGVKGTRDRLSSIFTYNTTTTTTTTLNSSNPATPLELNKTDITTNSSKPTTIITTPEVLLLATVNKTV